MMAISASWKPMATSSTDERCPGGLVSCKKEHMFSCLAGSSGLGEYYPFPQLIRGRTEN